MGLKWMRQPFFWRWVRLGIHSTDYDRLCLKCRNQGFILPADPGSPDMCRGHLAEARVNDLLGFKHG